MLMSLVHIGTGAWESALTNTLSPGDRIVSFLIGQFSLLWIDQQQRLNFNVDVIESDWGQGANLDVLASKLAADTAHTIKAVCIVHNETATGVTNNLAAVRKILGKIHFTTCRDQNTLWYVVPVVRKRKCFGNIFNMFRKQFENVAENLDMFQRITDCIGGTLKFCDSTHDSFCSPRKYKRFRPSN